MSDPTIALAAHDLRKTYLSGGNSIEILRGVELEVARGESISISGESGCGKTTLLNLLAGLDRGDAGTVSYATSPSATGASMEQIRAGQLGMVFQAHYLIPELNAVENVLMAGRMLGPVGRASRDRAAALLGRVGLAARTHHLPTQLSGGERQRVAVARALMNNPSVLLADEPTGNLDERTGDAVIELLLSLCRETGTALVLVTHNAAHAAKTARRLTLRDGRLYPPELSNTLPPTR
jgi:predicted ABC-type transport system involved in lysophospholipase L1 biosynthesis ATPase subunit